MKAINFSEMHVFPYSKRTGTPAARMEDQVDEEVKNARVQELLQLSDSMKLAYAQKFVGEVLEVIPEGNAKEGRVSGRLHGYSDNYIQMEFDGSEELVGQLCRVKMTKAGVDASEGQLVRVMENQAKIII